MKKMKKNWLWMAVLAAMLLWGCGEKDHLEVDPSELYGAWVQSGSEYYWTFNSDGTGSLVNRGEVAEGDDENGDFTWSLSDGDQLLAEFRGSGELGGIYIAKQYTITEITATALRWEDVYGRTTSLERI